jgi:hypothetical protein
MNKEMTEEEFNKLVQDPEKPIDKRFEEMQVEQTPLKVNQEWIIKPRPKRGGKRPGAGRPRLADGMPTTQLSMRVRVQDLEHWHVLKGIAGDYEGRSSAELFHHAMNLLHDFARHYKKYGYPKPMTGMMLESTHNSRDIMR